MTHTKALKLALEALELHLTHHEHGCVYLDPAITAIKEALAQPAQEPVATVTSESGNPNVTMSWWHEPALPVGTKLYTAPSQRPWVGLTDEELKKIWYDIKHLIGWYSFQESARATEAKLKERNS